MCFVFKERVREIVGLGLVKIFTPIDIEMVRISSVNLTRWDAKLEAYESIGFTMELAAES